MTINPRWAGIALTMACLHAASTPKPERCQPGVPAGAQHPITARARSLAGDYELIQVQTQPNAGVVRAGRLHLVPLDSERRLAATGGAARDLIGWLDPAPEDSGMRSPDAGSRDPSHPGVVLTGDHLRLGHAGGVDAYVEHLTITAVGSDGFWGWWRAEPGWNAAAPGSGTTPDPAGYFCARRVGS